MAKNKPTSENDAPPQGYTVLARRYRPQTFSDIIGQEAVARALVNALKSNRVAHAYLFTGARGVGKTSTARILAKALNCVKGPTATPCGECDPCKGIASGEDVDVLEIDGASNRGIDNIRELRSNTQYMPQRARFKIYIIDEVHMLSTPAFNALLKTLEEPPPHVKFIFATTEVEKVPITILSRCQRFDFAGIAVPRIVEQLRTIVSHEGTQADDDALELLARRAGGSMRDAQSLLDQLLAFGGDHLTVDQVHALLGTAGDDRILALVESVLSHHVAQTLDLLDDAVVAGLQLGELLDRMTAYWRDLMVVHCAGVEGRDLSVPSRHRQTLLTQAKALNLDTVLAGLDILAAARGQLKNSNHGRTLVEMALIRLGRLENLVALPQLVRWLDSAGERGRVSAPSAQAPSEALGARTQPRALVAPPEGLKKKPPTTAADGNDTAPLGPLTAQTLPAIWARTLRQVPPMLTRSLEKGGLPAIIAPNNLELCFALEYNVAKEHCQELSCIAAVEAKLRELTGQSWLVRISGSTSPPVALAAESQAVKTTAVGPRRNAREEAEKLPLVQHAIAVLKASLQRVDEGFGAMPNTASNGEQSPKEEAS